MRFFMRVLFIGEIVGRPGRQAVARWLPSLIREHRIGVVVANAENAAGGFGLTPAVAEELFALGIDVLTSGNHILDQKEVEEYLAKERRVLRPANYPEGVPGSGSLILEWNGLVVGVLNLQGRVFMPTLDCPFRTGELEVAKLKEATNVILVDFHAEATAEKAAFAWHFAGKVSAIIGTHTHVQTADERVLRGGTAFITDVGMTGPIHSVIGVRPEEPIQRFLTQMPRRFKVASGPCQLSGVVVEIDEESGRARSIVRLQLQEEG